MFHSHVSLPEGKSQEGFQGGQKQKVPKIIWPRGRTNIPLYTFLLKICWRLFNWFLNGPSHIWFPKMKVRSINFHCFTAQGCPRQFDGALVATSIVLYVGEGSFQFAVWWQWKILINIGANGNQKHP